MTSSPSELESIKGTSYMYTVFDTISGRFHADCVCANDTLAVRETLSTLRVPLKDSELYCIGEVQYDFKTEDKELVFGHHVKLTPMTPRKVPWSCYKFPETLADSLAPLGLSPDEVKVVVSRSQKKEDK